MSGAKLAQKNGKRKSAVVFNGTYVKFATSEFIRHVKIIATRKVGHYRKKGRNDNASISKKTARKFETLQAQ